MVQEGFAVDKEEQKLITRGTSVTGNWVLFDINGKRHILDLDKYAIMKRANINARDLRILDPTLSYPSTILGRERAIVLNLEVQHIKAVITKEEILLRDPSEDNVVPIVEQLQRRLTPTSALLEGQESPFEFRALEVVLEAICSFLDARTMELQVATYPALDELTFKASIMFKQMSSFNLDRVRRLKSAMTRLTNRVQKVRDELEQILDDEGGIRVLYLSRKISWSSLYISGEYSASSTIGSLSKASRASIITKDNDVEELEMLLELLVLWDIIAAYFTFTIGPLTYLMLVLVQLRKYITATEDYINIRVRIRELPL
ncbi:Magnesium transporter MRS2-I [Dionaea muscipula]